MPIIETKREDIRALEGVHLFHFATSNCSQRVRFVLEEKGVEWVSHHVNLIKCENATPEFVALNPKGVVPVLVHDGRTVVESNDIICYVDDQFDGPVLSPQTTEDKRYLGDSLNRSSDFQSALKLLTHEFLFKPVRRMNDRDLAAYAEGVRNDELIAFMREFSSRDGFLPERISKAVQETEDILRDMESRLGENHWLTGDEFGLTDISWVVNLHRFSHMHYPFHRYPLVAQWLNRMRERPTFRRAISDYESRKMLAVFTLYTLVRRIRRSSIRDFIQDC